MVMSWHSNTVVFKYFSVKHALNKSLFHSSLGKSQKATNSLGQTRAKLGTSYKVKDKNAATKFRILLVIYLLSSYNKHPYSITKYTKRSNFASQYSYCTFFPLSPEPHVSSRPHHDPTHSAQFWFNGCI
jgi:hypothetical protein